MARSFFLPVARMKSSLSRMASVGVHATVMLEWARVPLGC
jgi:hypothetical protein